MDKFRVIIAGGREFNDYALCKAALDKLLINKSDIVIVSGKARGADSLGERYARERGLPVEEYPANWDRFGKAAGYRRNKQMAEVADAVIAFWDGKSKGTGHMIDLAGTYNLQVRVINYT